MKLVTERVNNKKRINEAGKLRITDKWFDLQEIIEHELQPMCRLRLNLPMKFEDNSKFFLMPESGLSDDPIEKVEVIITDIKSVSYKIKYFLNFKSSGLTSRELLDFMSDVRVDSKAVESFVPKVIEKIKEYYTFD